MILLMTMINDNDNDDDIDNDNDIGNLTKTILRAQFHYYNYHDGNYHSCQVPLWYISF